MSVVVASRDLGQLGVESDALVENLDDVEREVCECGYSFVVVSVAAFQPIEVEGGELVQLRGRDDMPLAA